jgi:HSP20 family protein
MPPGRYPFSSIWKDFDEMLADMEHRFTAMMECLEPERSISIPNFPSRMLPALRGEFSVDVREHEQEIIVVADLPGVDKEDIRVCLVDPRTLEIVSMREKETGEEEGGYYMRERLYGSMRRRVILPSETTDVGTQASFKNGVLEVRLRKKGLFPEKQITIGD